MKTKISILGSTGSIGCSAVSLLENECYGQFEVQAISFHFNANLALKQAISLNAKEIIATSFEGFNEITKLSEGLKIKITFGKKALLEACRNNETEVILLAIVGFQGLEFALESILKEEKRVLAIANKEAIICGYHLIEKKLEGSKTKVLPIDSEHNSLYRLLKNFNTEDIRSMFITASGGPFLGKNFSDLENVSIQEVVRHPIWNMGAKISVDSATMANKGLEMIECYKLFDIKPKTLEAFVAKGSILHAGITLKDGGNLWFLSNPNMKNHISHAISNEKIQSLDLETPKIKNLEFEEILPSQFPIFFIAKNIAESGNINLAIAFNMINEIAVSKFLKSEIKYTQILDLIEENLSFNPDNFNFNSIAEIEEYFQILNTKLNFAKETTLKVA